MTASKEELAKVTERLNDALDAAEVILVDMAKGGASAFVDMSAGRLGVKKIGQNPGEWQLVWEHAAGEFQPVANASRAIRVEAAYKLNDLEKAIVAATDEEYSKVAAAAEHAWRFYETRRPVR